MLWITILQNCWNLLKNSPKATLCIKLSIVELGYTVYKSTTVIAHYNRVLVITKFKILSNKT